MNDVTMPEGTYYIGDLCYVLTDTQWDELCGFGDIEGKFTLSDGTVVAIMYTMYGDGEYESNKNTIHGVDSGTIGCVLESCMVEESKRPPNLIPQSASVVTFNEAFVVCKRSRGCLCFGDIMIDTEQADGDLNLWLEE